MFERITVKLRHRSSYFELFFKDTIRLQIYGPSALTDMLCSHINDIMLVDYKAFIVLLFTAKDQQAPSVMNGQVERQKSYSRVSNSVKR